MNFIKSLFGIVVLLVALSSSLLFNRFPLLHWDIAEYFSQMYFLGHRNLYYGFFVNTLIKIGFNPWGIAFLQIFLVLITLFVLASFFRLRLFSFCLLASPFLLLSTLPNVSIFFIPDFFFSVGALALYFLFSDFVLASRRWILLGGLFAIAVLATAVSTNHFLIYSIVFCFYLLKIFKEKISFKKLIVGIGLIIGIAGSYFLEQHIRQSYGTKTASRLSIYIVARFIEAGVLQAELPEICSGHPKIKLCAISPKLLSTNYDAFLWGVGDGRLFSKLYGTTPNSQDEFINAREDFEFLSYEVLKRKHIFLIPYIFPRIWSAITNWPMQQEIYVSWIRTHSNGNSIINVLENRFPGITPSVLRSAQFDDLKTTQLKKYACFISACFVFFFCVHLIILVWSRKRYRKLYDFAFYCLLLILINLFVCSVFSCPIGTRYFDRASWLSVLVAVLGLCYTSFFREKVFFKSLDHANENSIK